MQRISKEPRIAVIVLDFGRPDLTNRCISGFQSDHSIAIYIVENGSSDASLFNNGPNIRFLKNERNLGFAGGMNVGIRAAIRDGNEFIVLLNNDTCLTPISILQLVLTLQLNERAAVAIPNVSYSTGLLNGGGVSEPVLSSENPDIVGPHPIFREVSSITGFCMAFKSNVLMRLGLLDEDFFFTYEDDEIGLRIQKYGYTLMETLSSAVLHSIGSSIGKHKGQDYRFLIYHRARGSMILSRKYGMAKSRLVLKSIYETLRLFVKSIITTHEVRISLICYCISGLRDGQRLKIHSPPKL